MQVCTRSAPGLGPLQGAPGAPLDRPAVSAFISPLESCSGTQLRHQPCGNPAWTPRWALPAPPAPCAPAGLRPLVWGYFQGSARLGRGAAALCLSLPVGAQGIMSQPPWTLCIHGPSHKPKQNKNGFTLLSNGPVLPPAPAPPPALRSGSRESQDRSQHRLPQVARLSQRP